MFDPINFSEFYHVTVDIVKGTFIYSFKIIVRDVDTKLFVELFKIYDQRQVYLPPNDIQNSRI